MLTPADNIFEIDVDILKQLQIIHKFGVHNDIKPQHILRRSDGKYFLIGLETIATNKDHSRGGYLRKVWTPKYTSQEPHECGQITRPYNDFMELGSCLNALYNVRRQISKNHNNVKDINQDVYPRYLRSLSSADLWMFSGTLLSYIQEVDKLDKKQTNIGPDVYERLSDILLRDPSIAWKTVMPIISPKLVLDIVSMIEQYVDPLKWS